MSSILYKKQAPLWKQTFSFRHPLPNQSVVKKFEWQKFEVLEKFFLFHIFLNPY